MGYEQDEPYVVNDEGGEYIAQTPTEESARNHLVEYFTHQDAVLEHIGTGNNATIDLTIAVAEFDLGHPDLYKFHPTAEWSRITQALKERDELAAELERVKADLKNTIDAGKIVVRNELMAQSELESLKSRLPVNADGDVVLWGDTQFCHKHGEFQVTSMSDESLLAGCEGFYLNPFTKRVRIEDSFSTAESCRAAHEGKEGENDE